MNAILRALFLALHPLAIGARGGGLFGFLSGTGFGARVIEESFRPAGANLI